MTVNDMKIAIDSITKMAEQTGKAHEIRRKKWEIAKANGYNKQYTTTKTTKAEYAIILNSLIIACNIVLGL